MNKTDFLVTKPSFIRGMGTVLGIRGINHVKEHFYIDDMEALQADWYVVGNDMREVFDEFKTSSKK